MGQPELLGWGAVFVFGTALSLVTSWVLVSRIERVGTRLGASEALLGLIAALAADAPEISAAVTALSHHQESVGTGVVIGSNVFNLAALIGLGAVVSGGIALHRRVVVLAGSVAVWVASTALLAILGVVPPAGGLALVLAALVPYAGLAALGGRMVGADRSRGGLRRWLAGAIADEEAELAGAVSPGRGSSNDAVVAAAALGVVVIASVVVERAASRLGPHFGIPDIVTGGLVLAAVTSIPNAVAAVYLARSGRGAATLSTAFNSNSLNVAVGFLVPAAILGRASGGQGAPAVGIWYLALTGLVVVSAYVGRGVGRRAGSLVLGLYVAFAILLVTTGTT